MEVETGKAVASAIAPKKEMKIISENPGWAEQEPSRNLQNGGITSSPLHNK
jgi:hypothetical protein